MGVSKDARLKFFFFICVHFANTNIPRTDQIPTHTILLLSQLPGNSITAGDSLQIVIASVAGLVVDGAALGAYGGGWWDYAPEVGEVALFVGYAVFLGGGG